MNNALKDLVAESKCFSMARVGNVQGKTLTHNWMAVTVGPKPRGGGSRLIKNTSRSGPCTAWLDPWTESSPEVYLIDPETGMYGRPFGSDPSFANWIVSEYEMLEEYYEGREYPFGSEEYPTGVTGWFFTGTRFLPMSFEDDWSWPACG
ncbi:MAG: hypothetical protein H8E44_42315, partial [Planctomycetes bacterium]|nr:hypothetical protein [Planctomycetota bacterium]MBL7041607.1 hypothetical protein [Pirellulaceae bacterium]